MKRIFLLFTVVGLSLLLWPVEGFAQDQDRPRGVPDYNLTFTTVGALPRILNADSADVIISQNRLYDFTFEAGKVYYIPYTFWDRGEYDDKESVLLYGDNVAEPGAIILIAGGVDLEVVKGATFTIGRAGAEPVQILGHNQGNRALADPNNYRYSGRLEAGFNARGSVNATTRVVINNAIMSHMSGVYLDASNNMEVDIRGLQLLSEVYYVDVENAVWTVRPGSFSSSGRSGETPEESAARETTLRLTDCRLEGHFRMAHGANVSVYARNSFFMAPVDTAFYPDSTNISHISYPVEFGYFYSWMDENFRTPKDAKPPKSRAEFVDCSFSYAWYLDFDEKIKEYVSTYESWSDTTVTEELIEDVREAFYQSGMIRILETNSRGHLVQVWPPGDAAPTLTGDFEESFRQLLAGFGKPPTPESTASDLDHDGAITFKDVMELMRVIDRDYDDPVTLKRQLIRVAKETHPALGSSVELAIGYSYRDTMLAGDFNLDRAVNFADFIEFASAFGTTPESAAWLPIYDLDDSGAVDFGDFITFASNFGKTNAAGKPAGPGGLPGLKNFLFAEENAWALAMLERISPELYEFLAPKATLEQNFPNPFNPETTIRYRLAESSEVRLTVYNILGQAVRALVSEHQPAGEYTVLWDGQDEFGRTVSSGIYTYRLESSTFTQARKMLLLK